MLNRILQAAVWIEKDGAFMGVVIRAGDLENETDRAAIVAPCHIVGPPGTQTSIIGVTDASGELTLHHWAADESGVRVIDTNEESGKADRIACAGEGLEVVAAARDSDHELRAILYGLY